MSGAEEDYLATAKPRGAEKEVQGRLSPLSTPNSEAAAEEESAQGSPGRRDVVKGPGLRRLLWERLEEPNRAGIRSTWQDIELVWQVLRGLVARMDLGGMGPLVARALDPRRMTLAKKDVAEYAGVAILFYEQWAHRHEFLFRCQQRGETVEKYFRAKRELLVEGDTYRDMMAAYPAHWSGLRSWELVVLMDARVLGCVWPGQIGIGIGIFY